MPKIIPNSYSTPFVFVDLFMKFLSGNEYKCLNVVARKTFGWDKHTDRISKSQFVALTGLSEGTVDACMSELVKYGLAVRVSENNKNNHGVEWAIQRQEENIDMEGLEKRYQKTMGFSRKKTQHALLTRGVGVTNIPPPTNIPPGGMSNIPHNINYQQLNSSSSSAKREKIILFYQQEIGKVTPSLEKKIIKAKEEYGELTIHEAIEEAVTSTSNPNWNYIEAILKRWKSEGKEKTKGASNGNRSNRSSYKKHYRNNQRKKLSGEELERKRAEAAEAFRDLTPGVSASTDQEHSAADRATAQRIAERMRKQREQKPV